jgi:glutamine amidotransferase PdxT
LYNAYRKTVENLLSTLPVEERDLYKEDFEQILRDIETLIYQGQESTTIGNVIGNTDAYKRVIAKFPPHEVFSILNPLVTMHPFLKGNNIS